MFGDQSLALGDRFYFIYNSECSTSNPFYTLIASFVLILHVLLISCGFIAKRCNYVILYEFCGLELKLITPPPFMILIWWIKTLTKKPLEKQAHQNSENSFGHNRPKRSLGSSSPKPYFCHRTFPSHAGIPMVKSISLTTCLTAISLPMQTKEH